MKFHTSLQMQGSVRIHEFQKMLGLCENSHNLAPSGPKPASEKSLHQNCFSSSAMGSDFSK